MKMCFLLGNGFDIQLGMKTRYCDFYQSYIHLPSPSPMIANYKTEIALDVDQWSDLEDMLKYQTFGFQDFQNDEDYMDFVDDLLDELARYLRRQNARFRIGDAKGVEDIFETSEARLLQLWQAQQDPALPPPANSTVSYISFNYTEALASLLACGSRNRPLINPHGDLDSSIVLGVNNLLTPAVEFGLDTPVHHPLLDRWLIKENIIEGDGELKERYNQAYQTMFDSECIGIYGMSLGRSDMLWWKLVEDWLCEDEKHILFIFAYVQEQKINTRSPRQRYFNRGEPLKDKFMSYLNSQNAKDHKIEQRVHVVVNPDLFDFEPVVTYDTPASVGT